MRIYLIRYFFLSYFSFVFSQVQDYNIYGGYLVYNFPIDARTIDSLIGKCFRGLGFLNCKPQNFADPFVKANYLPYYLQLESIIDDYYCTQCCGINQNVDDWDLKCALRAVDALRSNVYGQVLYLAKNRFQGDRELVSCPLKRSACKYDGNDKTLSCDYVNDKTFLTKLTLTSNTFTQILFFSSFFL